MDDVEHLARTVAQQRTGDSERWLEFMPIVAEAIEKAERIPNAHPRDFLDEPA